jgi:hypothetical protein
LKLKIKVAAETEMSESFRGMQTGIGAFLVRNCRLSAHHRRLPGSICILLLLTIGAEGCKKSTGAVPVHGQVSFRGEPLPNASVSFFPKTGRAVAAAIDQGQYATELLPGEYSATVSVAVEIPKGYKEGDPLPPPKVVLPEEYTVANKSTLKATVKTGQSEPIDFDLK